MARNIIAYYSEELEDKQCRITDSYGAGVISGDPLVLFGFIAAHDAAAFHVVFDIGRFMKPIRQLMPPSVFKELYDTERVTWGEYRLFYPELSRGGILGINQKTKQQINGNFYQEIKRDLTLYDIAAYFPGEQCKNAGEVQSKGKELLATLDKMGFITTKLTTPAAIYEQAVLSKLPYATIYTLPDNCLDMMEWANNYIREWRSVYQVGIFEKGIAKDYDLTAAYPSIVAELPNMVGAEFHYSPDGTVPASAEWGLIRANIDVKADISPLVGDDEICRTGKRIDLISNEDADYCSRTGKAIIEPLEAWYFTLPAHRRIFDYSMRKLYNLRNGNELQSRVAKDMSVSVWGKMHEMKGDVPGQYCNFIYASMVASRCRLKVMRFIDDNHLHDSLVSVTVDGCVATKEDPEVSRNKVFGEWRVNPDSEAIILDTQNQWIGDKRQLGITASELIAEIKSHPSRQYYEGVYLALLEYDRDYPEKPLKGYDLLKNVYKSRAFNQLGGDVDSFHPSLL